MGFAWTLACIESIGRVGSRTISRNHIVLYTNYERLSHPLQGREFVVIALSASLLTIPFQNNFARSSLPLSRTLGRFSSYQNAARWHEWISTTPLIANTLINSVRDGCFEHLPQCFYIKHSKVEFVLLMTTSLGMT